MNDLTQARKLIKECKDTQNIYLDLGKCGITDLNKLPELFECTHLETLILSNQWWNKEYTKWFESANKGEKNKISYIPTEIGNLKNITRLYISGDWSGRWEISDIRCLENLTGLQNLDLRNNNLKEISKFISQLGMEINMEDSIEKGLCLYGNPIESPPMEILKQGKDTVLRHFDRIEKEGKDYIYEAKLILVGEGNSGKTSLQIRLLDERGKLPAKDERTRGIDVVNYEFEKGKVAHIWDFGGQDVYYPVHRFFITENSVFVLLASTREHHHNFDYWLPTIYQFGGESPIVIGQTCHNGLSIPWNNLGTYLSNPCFKIVNPVAEPYYKINLPDNNTGLSSIRQCIISQIEKLPHFGKGVAKSWLPVRNILLEKSKLIPCISFPEFVQLCRDSNSEGFADKQNIVDCCQFFNDIGVVLWYPKDDELCDWVILNPKWAMNAVYYLLDDKNIQENNGAIYPDDFKRLWKDTFYEEKHKMLKQMLKTFKIAFPTRQSNGKNYIIPAKLKSMPSEKKWTLEEESLRLEYKFEFMPTGIINQLSAELNGYIQDNEIWNNGVNFAFNDNQTQSQIIEDTYNRILTITSKGIDARGMNVLIMHSLENIIKSYKGVKAEIYVTCICDTCRQSDRPTTFCYDNLVKWSKRNPATVTCNNGQKELDILNLLYRVGFEKKEIPTEDEKRRMKEGNQSTHIEIGTMIISTEHNQDSKNTSKSYQNSVDAGENNEITDSNVIAGKNSIENTNIGNKNKSKNFIKGNPITTIILGVIASLIAAWIIWIISQF